MTKVVKVTPFYSMLSYLVMRHEMFEIDSLKELKIFISGYEFSMQTNNLKDVELEHFYKFDDFVKKKFKDSSTQSWASTIEENCPKEIEQITFFNSLISEFRNE